MAKIDDEIQDAINKLNYYFRNRQKHLDNREKFNYYHERCIIKEERLALLYKKKNGRKNEK
jgi:hypothetical protein